MLQLMNLHVYPDRGSLKASKQALIGEGYQNFRVGQCCNSSRKDIVLK